MTLKPGVKTTEFWVTTIASVAAVVAAAADWLPPRYAAYVAIASQGLYALSRGIAKAGATLGVVPAVTVPAQPPEPPAV